MVRRRRQPRSGTHRRGHLGAIAHALLPVQSDIRSWRAHVRLDGAARQYDGSGARRCTLGSSRDVPDGPRGPEATLSCAPGEEMTEIGRSAGSAQRSAGGPGRRPAVPCTAGEPMAEIGDHPGAAAQASGGGGPGAGDRLGPRARRSEPRLRRVLSGSLVFEGVARERDPSVDPELLGEVRDVAPNRVYADPQLAGDGR